MKNNSPLWT